MYSCLAQKARGAVSLARELLFPLGCAVCGAPLLAAEDAGRGLCRGCADLFVCDSGACAPAGGVPALPTRCEVCGRPLVSEFRVCVPCRSREERFAFDRALSLYPYAGACRTLLSAYKFGKHRLLARFFAQKLYAEVSRFFSAQGTPLEGFAWVPVPARAGKIKETGWDQVDVIARMLGREYGLPVQRPLKRLKSCSQKTLGRQGRLVNLKGRIVAAGPAPRVVILIDDVFTTGATLSVCAEALKAAGSEYVFGVCLFYD